MSKKTGAAVVESNGRKSPIKGKYGLSVASAGDGFT